MTTRFLQSLQSDLWTEITSLAKEAERRYAAVAYLGTGATRLLPLKRGDVLVVDMSLASIRAGRTNPAEIEKYLKRGVEVYSCHNLHAKVFVFDDMAIVGSANVSKNSQELLIEAALFTTDTTVVDSVRNFIFSLKGEIVTPEYVETCKKEYKPPILPPSVHRPKRSGTVVPVHPRLRIERVYPITIDSQEEKLLEGGVEKAEKKLGDTQLYTVHSVRFPEGSTLAKKAEIGDLVIQVWKEKDGKLWVYPPGRIVYIQLYTRSRDNRRFKFIHLEAPKQPRLVPWEKFRSVLRKKLARVGKHHISREITDAQLKHELLCLWQGGGGP